MGTTANGLYALLQSRSVQVSADGERFRVQFPVHPDNLNSLGARLERDGEKYVSPWTDVNSISTIIALEGPIFRAAPQLLHMSMALEGLKYGYLCADPITFAEEFPAPGTSPETARKQIYENWKKVVENSDATVAFIEYGNEYDPGVVIGCIMQLARNKPVLGLRLQRSHRHDIFVQSIKNHALTREETLDIVRGSGTTIERILESLDYVSVGGRFPTVTEKKYDVFVVHEQTVDGIVTAENVRQSLTKAGREVATSGDIQEVIALHGLYDFAKYVGQARRVVVLADNTAEPGLLGSSALQLASMMEIPVDVLRGDFRILTGEGTGAGMNQPAKGLVGAANLMVEHLLPQGIYTRTEALVEALRK